MLILMSICLVFVIIFLVAWGRNEENIFVHSMSEGSKIVSSDRIKIEKKMIVDFMCNKWLIKLFCFQKRKKVYFKGSFDGTHLTSAMCFQDLSIVSKAPFTFKLNSLNIITTNIHSLHNNVLIINSLLTFIINYSIHFYPHTLHRKQTMRNHLRFDYVHFRRFYSSPQLPLPRVFLLQHQLHCLVIP